MWYDRFIWDVCIALDLVMSFILFWEKSLLCSVHSLKQGICISQSLNSFGKEQQKVVFWCRIKIKQINKYIWYSNFKPVTRQRWNDTDFFLMLTPISFISINNVKPKWFRNWPESNVLVPSHSPPHSLLEGARSSNELN